MTEEANKNKDLDEILVDLPSTDAEIFGHILFGIKPERQPVKMTRGNYRLLQQSYSMVLAGILIVGTIAGYHDIKKEYGSISQAYKSFIENVEKIPLHALYP